MKFLSTRIVRIHRSRSSLGSSDAITITSVILPFIRLRLLHSLYPNPHSSRRYNIAFDSWSPHKPMSTPNAETSRNLTSPPPGATSPTGSSNPRSPPQPLAHLPPRPSPLSGTLSGVPRSVSNPAQDAGASLRAALNKPGIGRGKGRVLGIQDRLRKEVDGVVKRRSGGVLGRG